MYNRTDTFNLNYTIFETQQLEMFDGHGWAWRLRWIDSEEGFLLHIRIKMVRKYI